MAEKPPLHGWTLLLVTFALAMGNFMEVLDITIANVSVPSIAGDLGVSPNQGTWVITTYAVASAISMLLTGFLTGRFGQVRVFLAATALFTLASLACGLSTSFEMLIACRIAQGAVSGLIVSLSQSLLLASYPPAKRDLGMAVWAMTVLIAPVLGPVLGGWITDNINWRWIFFINIPVGVLVVFLAWELLHDRESETWRAPVDWVGLGLILMWVSALQILLDKGHELDWFQSSLIRALAAVCAAGFMLFLAWEINTNHPIVDLRLFRNRSFIAGVGGLCFGFAALFATMVVQPLWLQTQMGYTASWAGLVLAPMGILALLFSPLVGVSLARVDARYFATIGLIVLAVAGFIRAGYSTDADYAAIAYPQWITGIGMALLMPPLVTMSLADLPPNKAALGSGIQNFSRMTIGSFAASLAITLWDHRTVLHASALVERLGSFDPGYRNAVDVATAAGLPPAAADAQLVFEVARQASVRGIDDVFWLSAFVFLAAIPIIWIARRPTHTTMTAH